jgi:hypothetical protein
MMSDATDRGSMALREQAKDLLKAYISWSVKRRPPYLIFRGQAQKWGLKPSVGRNRAKYSLAKEKKLFDEFKKFARRYVADASSFTEWDWLFVVSGPIKVLAPEGGR